MRKLARWAAAALLIAVMAVTPLSAVFSAGRIETTLPGNRYGRPAVQVVVDDQTGLVRDVTAATSINSANDMGSVTNPEGDRRVLLVTWGGGCGDYRAVLTLSRQGDRYRLVERTDEAGCFHLMLFTRSAALRLWSPVDASLVDFDPELKTAD